MRERQMGHDVGVHSAIRRKGRECGMDIARERSERLCRLRLEVEDTRKASHLSKRKRENTMRSKQTPEPPEHIASDRIGRNERVQYRNVSRHTECRDRVETIAEPCDDRRLGLAG